MKGVCRNSSYLIGESRDSDYENDPYRDLIGTNRESGHLEGTNISDLYNVTIIIEGSDGYPLQLWHAGV